MKYAAGQIALACLLLWRFAPGVVAAGLPGDAGFFVFDVPQAGKEAAQGTSPQGINDDGVIAGHFVDSNGATHGFLRSRDGMFTTFDATAGTNAGTFPRSISGGAKIAGYFASDPDGTRHGFIREQDGTIKNVDPTGSISTVLQGIAGNGDGMGNFVSEDSAHAFILRADGSIATFDPPGSYNTAPQAMNSRGEIAGYYEDVLGVLHSFVRHVDGTFDTFFVSNASKDKGQGTYAIAMNNKGEIAGYYNSGPYNATHGFLRRSDGTIVTFEPPGSITDSGAHQDEEGYVVRPVTAPTGINDQEEVVGYYGDASGALHGFLRRKDGSFRTLDAPAASKHSDLGTFPMGINNSGTITGYFYGDADGALHGFVVKTREATIRRPPAEKSKAGSH